MFILGKKQRKTTEKNIGQDYRLEPTHFYRNAFLVITLAEKYTKIKSDKH